MQSVSFGGSFAEEALRFKQAEWTLGQFLQGVRRV